MIIHRQSCIAVDVVFSFVMRIFVLKHTETAHESHDLNMEFARVDNRFEQV